MSCWTTSGASRLRMKRKLQRGEGKLSGSFEREAQAKASLLQLPLHQVECSQDSSTIEIGRKQFTKEGHKRHHEQQRQQPSRRRCRRTSFTSSEVIQVQPQIQSFRQNYQPTQYPNSFEFENVKDNAVPESSGHAYQIAPPFFPQRSCNTNFDYFGEYDSNSNPSINGEKGMFFPEALQQPFGQTESALSSKSNGICAHALPHVPRQQSPPTFQQLSDDQDLSAFFGINSLMECSIDTEVNEKLATFPRLPQNGQLSQYATIGANNEPEAINDDDFLVFQMTNGFEHHINNCFSTQSFSNNSFLPWERSHIGLQHNVSGPNDGGNDSPIVSDPVDEEEIVQDHHPFKIHHGQIVRFFDNGMEVNPGKIIRSSFTESRPLRTAIMNNNEPENLHQIMGVMECCQEIPSKTNKPLADVSNLTKVTPFLYSNCFLDRKEAVLKAPSPLPQISVESHKVGFKAAGTTRSAPPEFTTQRKETWNLFGTKVKD